MSLSNIILYLLIEMIMMFVMLYSIKNVGEFKYKNKLIIIISLIISSILILINNLYTVVNFKIFITFIVSFILLNICTEGKLKSKFFHLIIYGLISIIFDIVLSLIIININNLMELNLNTLIKVTISIIHSICMLLIYKSNQFKNYLLKIEKNFINYMNFYTMTMMIILILNIIIYIRSRKMDNVSIIIGIILIIYFMYILIQIILREKNNIIDLENKNKSLLESYDSYSEAIEECRVFKHNLNNDMYSLMTVLPNKYRRNVEMLIKKYNKSTDNICNLKNVPSGIQGILYMKINEARKKGINIFLNTCDKITINNSDYFDLCTVIGVTIDNSIEASVDNSAKVIAINIYDKNDNLEFDIINKFNNNIDLDNIGKLNYSTKKRNSGIGLNYISRLNNKKITYKMEIKGDLFIYKIIYLKK